MDEKSVLRETYVAYMLRLWWSGSRDGRPIWRASLEDAHTGERLAFGDTEEMLAFLGERIAILADPRDAQGHPMAQPPDGDAEARDSSGGATEISGADESRAR
jgi:hypothetical protein